VAGLIKEGSALDAEALKRAATTYVKKTLTLPMLPRDLNAGKCSLSYNNERLCVTLSLMINDEGIADFSSAAYSMTVIKNTARLTYSEAD
jgi:exoribonuclease R